MSLVISLFVAELAVRIILPQDKMVTWLEMHPDGFMMNQSGGKAFQELGDIKLITVLQKTGSEVNPVIVMQIRKF